MVVAKEELVEESSSDEEAEDVEQDGDVDRATKKPKLIMNPSIPNVIYIGHLPRDCEERALTEFLKQFGRLVQMRVCRSHKTGGSKGYAFAKFHSPEVAAIAADTLNGHLLFQKRLVSHVLAPEQNHPKLFSSHAPTKFQKKPQQTGPKSLEKMEAVTKRLKEGAEKKRVTLKAMGIDYDFPGYEAAGTTAKNEKDDSDDNAITEGKVVTKKTKKDATPSSAKAGKNKRKKSIDAAEDEESSPPKQTKKEKAKAKPQSEKKAEKKKGKNRRKST